MEALIDYINKKEEEMLALLEKLVNIDCGTYTRSGVDQVGDILAEKLTSLGFSTERSRQEKYGDHVIGHKTGSGKDPGDLAEARYRAQRRHAGSHGDDGTYAHGGGPALREHHPPMQPDRTRRRLGGVHGCIGAG